MPYWKALLDSWSALNVQTVVLEHCQYFSDIGLSRALREFSRLATEIAAGNSPEDRVQRMRQIAQEASGPYLLKEAKYAPQHELIGILRSSADFGQAATTALKQIRDPLAAAALECVRYSAAVAIDGLSTPDTYLGNPFDHNAVLESLAELRRLVRDQPRTTAPTPIPLRETVKRIVPRT